MDCSIVNTESNRIVLMNISISVPVTNPVLAGRSEVIHVAETSTVMLLNMELPESRFDTGDPH